MDSIAPKERATAYTLLNLGHVRLVASMGNDLAIVRAARVSFDAAWRAGVDEGKDAKLIHYLMKNNHTTPFESVVSSSTSSARSS
jgi:thymidylate synthase (FAD)